MQVYTCSRQLLVLNNTYMTYSLPHMLILINDSDEEIVTPKVNSKCKHTLKVVFEDTESLDTNQLHFNHEIAKQILDFVNKHVDECSAIVVSSKENVGRAPAVGAALSKILTHKDDYVFSKGCPNMMVYTTLLDEYYATPDRVAKYPRIDYVAKYNAKNNLNPMMYKHYQKRNER